jgi:hypothetical protein
LIVQLYVLNAILVKEDKKLKDWDRIVSRNELSHSCVHQAIIL